MIRLSLAGKVRSSQTGFGMGISFMGMGAEDFEILRQFAPPTGNAPAQAADPPDRAAPPRPTAPVPEIEASPSTRSYATDDANPLDLTPTAEALEALVRLLMRKELFTQEELVEELEKSRIIQR
jgi:hypothetical protein